MGENSSNTNCKLRKPKHKQMKTFSSTERPPMSFLHLMNVLKLLKQLSAECAQQIVEPLLRPVVVVVLPTLLPANLSSPVKKYGRTKFTKSTNHHHTTSSHPEIEDLSLMVHG